MFASRMMMGNRGKRNQPNSGNSRQSQARSATTMTSAADRECQEADNAIVAKGILFLPKFLAVFGAVLFLVGIPVLICGYVDSLNYTDGQRSGPALIVFGFIIFLVGFIWLKLRESRANKLMKESGQVRDNQVSDSRQSSVAGNSVASVSRQDNHSTRNAAKTEDIKPKLDKNAAASPPDVGTGLPNDGYEVDLSDVDEKRDAEKV